MALRLDETSHGLRTEREFRLHRMLQDYDRNLSLRRIPEGDPSFGQYTGELLITHGVWEEGVNTLGGAISNWVLRVPEESLDDRLFARVIDSDMAKNGTVNERVRKAEALRQAEDLGRKRAMMDLLEERQDEMMTIGKLAGTKSTIRHKINGEDVIIGDTVRSARTHV